MADWKPSSTPGNRKMNERGSQSPASAEADWRWSWDGVDLRRHVRLLPTCATRRAVGLLRDPAAVRSEAAEQYHHAELLERHDIGSRDRGVTMAPPRLKSLRPAADAALSRPRTAPQHDGRERRPVSSSRRERGTPSRVDSERCRLR